jgi:hypothetical protein
MTVFNRLLAIIGVNCPTSKSIYALGGKRGYQPSEDHEQANITNVEQNDFENPAAVLPTTTADVPRENASSLATKAPRIADEPAAARRSYRSDGGDTSTSTTAAEEEEEAEAEAAEAAEAEAVATSHIHHVSSATTATPFGGKRSDVHVLQPLRCDSALEHLAIAYSGVYDAILTNLSQTSRWGLYKFWNPVETHSMKPRGD